MSDQETRLREGLALADELREALDDPERGVWGGYPWEHLGDAELDVRKLLSALRAVEAERDAAVKALEAAYVADGLRHGFTPARAQAEADANLASLSAADTEPGGEG